MMRRMPTSSLMVFAGALLGLISGCIIGAGIGSIGDYLLHTIGEYLWFGGLLSALVGLIVGACTILLGVRTRFGFEWVFIIGIAIPLGLWLAGTPWGSTYGLRLSVITTPVGWLVVHLVRKVFSQKIFNGSLQPWVLAVYFLIFLLVMISAPEFLSAVHLVLGM